MHEPVWGSGAAAAASDDDGDDADADDDEDEAPPVLTFEVTVKEVKERVLPDLDDARRPAGDGIVGLWRGRTRVESAP